MGCEAGGFAPRTGRLIVVLLILGACTPPVKQYQLRDRPMTCDDANRLAYKTLQSMRFTIRDFEPATYGAIGELKGDRRRGDADAQRQRVTVKIECSAAGVSLDASDDHAWIDQLDFKRSFFMAFTNVVSVTGANEEMDRRVAAGTAPESQQRRDLQVDVEQITGQGAKLSVGIDLAAAGVLPIRIRVVNHTERAYTFDPDDIRLRRRDRERAEPLAVEEVSARVVRARDAETGEPITPLSAAEVAEKLNAELLGSMKLEPAGQTIGYLYFPLAEYEGMRIVFTDVASEEPEGVMVGF